MTRRTLWLPLHLPGLNELLRWKGGTKRGWSRYTVEKAQIENTIALLARNRMRSPIEAGFFTYLLVEPNRRRDPSNIAAAAVKLIEDGLQKAGILANDGWKQIHGIATHWTVAQPSGVLVVVDPERLLDRDEVMGELVRKEVA